jgi:hypothetical protein
MARDIFNRATNTIGDSWSTDGASITFGGPAEVVGSFGAGMLVQQTNVGYQQQVTRIYEIGSDYTYFIAGRVQGNLTIGRIIGPSVIMSSFYTTFGNPCNVRQNVMQLNVASTCEGGAFKKAASYLISYIILTSVGLTVGAQDMVVNEQLQMMFVKMEMGGTASAISTLLAAGPGRLAA